MINLCHSKAVERKNSAARRIVINHQSWNPPVRPCRKARSASTTVRLLDNKQIVARIGTASSCAG
jgi:hypothetical protein